MPTPEVLRVLAGLIGFAILELGDHSGSAAGADRICMRDLSLFFLSLFLSLSLHILIYVGVRNRPADPT